jgi:hypothetical protein
MYLVETALVTERLINAILLPVLRRIDSLFVETGPITPCMYLFIFVLVITLSVRQPKESKAETEDIEKRKAEIEDIERLFKVRYGINPEDEVFKLYIQRLVEHKQNECT